MASSYGTPTDNPGLVTHKLTFWRDNGPTTPGDFLTLHHAVYEDGGILPQALLDFIDSVVAGTPWQFSGGEKTYPTTEQILP